MSGSLDIVGTGIKAISHVTFEARSAMERADFLFYLVVDPLTEDWITSLNPNSRTLKDQYDESLPRLASYERMIGLVMSEVEAGKQVCLALYGHPSVFVYPSHELSKRCRALGVRCETQPGISADAALFADLGVDPARDGMLSFEATDFLLFHRPLSPASALLVWQVGMIGDLGFHKRRNAAKGLRVLRDRLLSAYPPDHPCFVYEAATLPLIDHVCHEVALEDLAEAPVSAISTLYLPPTARPEIDLAAAEALGLSMEKIRRESATYRRREAMAQPAET